MVSAKTVIKRVLEGLWSIGVLGFFLLPELFSELPGPLKMGAVLEESGFLLESKIVIALLITIMICLLWYLISLFASRFVPVLFHPDNVFPIILNLTSSASIIAICTIHMISLADRIAYFWFLPWWIPLAVGLSLAWNVYNLIRITKNLSLLDKGYREYQEFKQTLKAEKKKALTVLVESGIQRRLTIAFSGLMLFIIVVLATVLLSDFGSSILKAITENGQALAERAANIVKSNAGDSIAISDYFSVEASKLETASFPYFHMSFYSLNSRTGEISVYASTDQELLGQTASVAIPEGNEQIVDAELGLIEFRSAVILSGRPIGFISVVYDKDVIYAPYFRSRIKTIVIATIFLYIAVFFTYIIGRGIVFPILFLRMGVNSLSTRLDEMVKGISRVSADALDYEDRVGTRDEIKKLSLEIGNMATVIRGVVPYISASTLKHADREKAISERREMAFLFTDIRGFTSLCEDKEPEMVVSLLNKYLEIQAKAVLDNGGDIDKFVGDEVMAMFEGPQKEMNACRAALEIKAVMSKEHDDTLSEFGADIAVGLGINTGPVIFGSVGARDRRDFTSIGDTVNLASRLESANKTYGTSSLISEAVFTKVENAFICREIDLITVKGKEQPVRIYEILSSIHNVSGCTELKNNFEKGLAFYRTRKWDRAEKLFGQCVEEFNDEAAAVFLKRIELFRSAPPPPRWNGVFRMTVK